MATNPVRVPEAVHDEVHTVARLFGCNASELLERAWHSFRQSPEFVTEFEQARKAFSTGDLDQVASRLYEQSAQRAKRRADSVKALRQET
ncbi:MAG: hypothetical protein ACLPXU_08720 [Acidimicrobiales bacterium]